MIMVELDAMGCVVRHRSEPDFIIAENGTEIANPVPAGWVGIDAETSALVATHRLMLGQWVPRPVCPQPAKVGPNEWRVESCPDGCVADVYDEAFGALMGQAEAAGGLITIELPDPGRYVVEVSAPSPWLRARARIEVAS